ncbi:MAG: acyltransferase [Methylococcaceae bacterium]|nr:acyltransferase [Methylococcaceae bacterium]
MLKGRELSDNKFQLNALDGLRGAACLIVILSHTSNEGIYFADNLDFSGIGKSGVFLFFILSSFLLTYPFIVKGAEAFNNNFITSYFVRRFFRIYPLYLVYLLVALFTSLLLGRILQLDKVIGIPFNLSTREFIKHLLLIQGKGVSWSILVEFKFYFLLPLLGLTFSVLLKNRILPVSALTVVLIAVSQKFWPQAESAINEIRLGYYLPIFFMGSMLSVLYHHWKTNNLIDNKKIALLMEISGLIAAVALIGMTPSISAWLLNHPVPRDFYHKQFVLYGFLWAIVVFATITGTGILRSVFELEFLRYFGFISFSMYLLHIIPLFISRKLDLNIPNDFPMLAWIFLAVTIAVSHLTWMFIEKPTSKIRYNPSARFGLSFGNK